jgi:hypothetical protein
MTFHERRIHSFTEAVWEPNPAALSPHPEDPARRFLPGRTNVQCEGGPFPVKVNGPVQTPIPSELAASPESVTLAEGAQRPPHSQFTRIGIEAN